MKTHSIAACTLALVVAAACSGKPAGPTPTLLVPEAGVALALPGWEVFPKALQGMPSLGKGPALTPGAAPNEYEVHMREADGDTVARHRQGVLLTLRQTTDARQPCEQAFVLGRTLDGAAAPHTVGGIAGHRATTTQQAEGLGEAGVLMARTFSFGAKEKCFQVEVATVKKNFDRVDEIMDEAIAALRPL